MEPKTAQTVSEKDAYGIAREAYVYAYPLVDAAAGETVALARISRR
jgi:hypothetical protein